VYDRLQLLEGLGVVDDTARQFFAVDAAVLAGARKSLPDRRDGFAVIELVSPRTSMIATMPESRPAAETRVAGTWAIPALTGKCTRFVQYGLSGASEGTASGLNQGPGTSWHHNVVSADDNIDRHNRNARSL
jgi:hypothetical protein